MASKNYAANLKVGATMSSTVGRVFGGLKTKLKEQENSLKSLRAEHKLAAKGTGEYAGKLDQLQREIDQTERGLKRLRAASKFDIGKSLRGVGSTIGKDLSRVGIAGGVIGGVGIGLVKNMLDVTAAFESSLMSLEMFEGSAAGAQKSFAWIEKFATKTPYEIQTLTNAFIKLRGYGIDPINGDTMRILGDTASATGKDIMQGVEALADATIGQNVRLKEAFAIDADLKGQKVLYRYTDKLGKDRVVSVDKNNKKLIKSTLLAILNDRYKGAMEKQSKTWNGMVSNMKDHWAQFAYKVMQTGPFKELKAKLGSVLEKLGEWEKDGTIKRWAAKTGEWMVVTGTKIGEVATSIWETTKAVKDFVGGWKNLGVILLAINFAPTILAVGQLAVVLYRLGPAWIVGMGPVGWVAAGIAIIGLAIVSLVDPGGPMDLLGKIFPETMEKIRKSVEKAVNWISNKFDILGDKVGGFVKKLGKLTGLAGYFDTGVGVVSNGDLRRQHELPMTRYGGGGLTVSGKSPNINGSIGANPPAAIDPNQLLQWVKSGGDKTNNFEINVSSAPGADGAAIAGQIRNEIIRKPLYDID